MADYKIVYHDDTIEIVENVNNLVYGCGLFKFIFKGGKWRIIETSIVKRLSTI